MRHLLWNQSIVLNHEKLEPHTYEHASVTDAGLARRLCGQSCSALALAVTLIDEATRPAIDRPGRKTGTGAVAPVTDSVSWPRPNLQGHTFSLFINSLPV